MCMIYSLCPMRKKRVIVVCLGTLPLLALLLPRVRHLLRSVLVGRGDQPRAGGCVWRVESQDAADDLLQLDLHDRASAARPVREVILVRRAPTVALLA